MSAGKGLILPACQYANSRCRRHTPLFHGKGQKLGKNGNNFFHVPFPFQSFFARSANRLLLLRACQTDGLFLRCKRIPRAEQVFQIADRLSLLKARLNQRVDLQLDHSAAVDGVAQTGIDRSGFK